MKILLTGEHGRLVNRFKEYAGIGHPDFDITLLSLKNEEWLQHDFSCYDVIIHCAALINSDTEGYEAYKKVNVDLTGRVFRKAMEEKVAHFVYLSSMAVYDGTDWGFGDDGIIRGNTRPSPGSHYGRSKYEAEQLLEELKDTSIRISIIRAPSIIGNGMEDYFRNYIRFSNIPILPIPMIHREAKRSFIFIDTLIEFMCGIVTERKPGIFYPQSLPALSVSEMYEQVCISRNKKRAKLSISSKLIPKRLEKRLFKQIAYDTELSYDENRKAGKISSQEAIYRAMNGDC